MSTHPLTISELDLALKQTTNELRTAQRTSNGAYNAAKRSISRIQSLLANTQGNLLDTNNLGAAASKINNKHMAPANVNSKINVLRFAASSNENPITQTDSSESDGCSIFYEHSGLTPPDANKINEIKTPSNTPNDVEELVLVSSNIKYDHVSSSSSAFQGQKANNQPSSTKKTSAPAKKTSPTKNCPSCGKKIAVACRKCPHCGASALKQDKRSKLLRKRRQEQSAKESKKSRKNTTITNKANI